MRCLRLIACLTWMLPAAPPGDAGLVVILLGPPGSGKSTQAKHLQQSYRIPAISASELLKQSHGRKSRISRAVAAPVASGELVSDETINQLVQFRIQKRDALQGFILDGYPRTKAQAEFLAGQLKERGLPEPVVIHLDAPDAVVKQRMEARRRADDKPAIIERRLSDYHDEKDFLLGYYAPSRLFRVDATKPEKEVSRDIAALLAGRR